MENDSITNAEKESDHASESIYISDLTMDPIEIEMDSNDSITTADDKLVHTDSKLDNSVNKKMNAPSLIIEAKFSYFDFSSHQLRKIYHNGGINYELAASMPVWYGLNIWAAADYFSKDSHSLGGHQKTEIRIIPLTLGLKYIYAIKNFSLYVGTGFRYFFVRTRNHSHYVDHKISRSGLGGVVEGGALYLFAKHFVLDVFGSYSFKKLHTHTSRHAVYTHGEQVGGWNVGGGIGYKF